MSQCGFSLQNNQFGPTSYNSKIQVEEASEGGRQRVVMKYNILTQTYTLTPLHKEKKGKKKHLKQRSLRLENKEFVCMLNSKKEKVETLIVIGTSTVLEAASTMPFIRIGLLSRADPAPLLTTISIGHPIFISMKSTVHSWFISSTARATVSGYAPQICTPNRSSDESRRRRAHSEA